MADKIILFGFAAILLALAFASDAQPARQEALDNLHTTPAPEGTE